MLLCRYLMRSPGWKTDSSELTREKLEEVLLGPFPPPVLLLIMDSSESIFVVSRKLFGGRPWLWWLCPLFARTRPCCCPLKLLPLWLWLR